MKKTAIVILWLIAPLWLMGQGQDALTLWYNEPAKNWNEALPIGSGRLGAMVHGHAAHELIQLNEETLWTGGPVDLNPNPEAPGFLPEVRQALFSNNHGQAVSALRKMQGHNSDAYQPLGDFEIIQNLVGETTEYRRDLDISKAVATTKFTSGGFEVDIYWEKGKMTKAVIKSTIGGECHLRTHQPIKILKTKTKSAPVKFYDTRHFITTFKTVAGKSYAVELK